MQAIGETIFDIIYLSLVITTGILMIIKSNGNRQYRIFGIMAVILGAGDAFHLIPRSYALCTSGLQNFPEALGIGKLVTSITMTVFYVLLYRVWQMRYHEEGKKGLSAAVYVLAAVRITLCLFPQNKWTSPDAPLTWGIYRNIPFVVLGILIIVLFFGKAKKSGDSRFRFMWLAILFSFAFYVPVVLWAGTIPPIGMLMIPKTCMYVWIVLMGYSAMKKQ